MKKFKTSAEKRHLQEVRLTQMLAEKNFVRTALLNYTHLPLGLIVALLMLVCSWLGLRSFASPENALLVYLGIGMVACFYMLQAYEAFARHRAQLRSVRNGFVGNPVLPGGFGVLMLFIAFSLNLQVFSLTGILLMLALCFHLPILGKPLRQYELVARTLPAVYFTALLWLALLAPQATPTPAALGFSGLTLLAWLAVGLRLPAWMQLETDAALGV